MEVRSEVSATINLGGEEHEVVTLQCPKEALLSTTLVELKEKCMQILGAHLQRHSVPLDEPDLDVLDETMDDDDNEEDVTTKKPVEGAAPPKKKSNQIPQSPTSHTFSLSILLFFTKLMYSPRNGIPSRSPTLLNHRREKSEDYSSIISLKQQARALLGFRI